MKSKPVETATVEAQEEDNLLMPLQDDVTEASEEVTETELPEYDFSAHELTVTIQYPSSFSGKRYFRNGEKVTVSGEGARIFRNKGII